MYEGELALQYAYVSEDPSKADVDDEEDGSEEDGSADDDDGGAVDLFFAWPVDLLHFRFGCDHEFRNVGLIENPEEKGTPESDHGEGHTALPVNGVSLDVLHLLPDVENAREDKCAGTDPSQCARPVPLAGFVYFKSHVFLTESLT